MENHYIYHKDDISWSLFADKYTGFSESYDLLSDIASVLDEVRWVFSETFEPETIKAHPILSVLHCEDGPITYRKRMLIFLSSRGTYYINHIYQFAHELCHFMVTEDTVDEYRWLNETLCQMMSWYAMNYIYESRNDRKLEQLSSLYEKMPSYINDVMEDRDDLHGESIAKYIQQNLTHLQNSGEDRRKNNTIAYEIYPLFREHTELWKIVPFLDQLKSGMTLPDALRTLCNAANIPSDVLDLLTQRLCEQPPVAPQ